MHPALPSRLILSVLCLRSRIANAHNSNVSNKFANDGSFLQQFLKLQKAQTSTGKRDHPILCHLLLGLPLLTLSPQGPWYPKSGRSHLMPCSSHPLLIEHLRSTCSHRKCPGENADPAIQVLTHKN